MYKCVIQYCYSAHTDLLWVITKFPTIICSKEKKHKQKKILRLLGKHLNSYASRHKTVCGLKFFSLWTSNLCNNLLQSFWHAHLKLANFINALLKKVGNFSDPACPLCTHMKNESLSYFAYHEQFCLL